MWHAVLLATYVAYDFVINCCEEPETNVIIEDVELLQLKHY